MSSYGALATRLGGLLYHVVGVNRANKPVSLSAKTRSEHANILWTAAGT